MKISRLLSLLCLATSLGFFSCTRHVTIESDVHPDGSIDRTITLHEADSTMASKNILGIGASTGWDVQKDTSGKALTYTFHKHFASVDESNRELGSDADTLFHIRSTFEKEFRWFYTYIRYEDTYASLNRFPGEPATDYLTPEDYAFIKRLPPEGKPLSIADSIYLDQLNHKVYDTYAAHTMFTELYNDLLSVFKKYHVDEQSTRKLESQEKNMLKALVKEGDTSDYSLLYTVDSLGIVLPDEARSDYKRQCDAFNKRLEMVSEAGSWNATHIIHMPWEVVTTNADSVAGNTLFWNPPTIKFLLTDYTMSAESRKLNLIPVVVSALILLISVGLLFLKRR